jgi:hypothetical protein
MSCGVSGASSANSTFAIRVPVVVGTKMELTLQEAPIANAPVQLFAVMEKSPGFSPVTVTPVKFATAVPLFVTVNAAVLLVFPSIREPKSQLAFENVRLGKFPIPVPATGML